MAGELFTDNPLIGSFYNALGMQGILPGNAEPAAAAPQQAKMPAPGRSKPNIAPYRNRPYIPRMLDPTAAHANRGGVMPGGEEPMMSEDMLKSPQMAALLGHFGVSNQVDVDPNLFIHNPQTWQNHPRIAGALEGALSGLAFTNGGNTIGESISNVARGMMDSQSAHAQHVNAQLMMPFQQAQAVGQLQNMAGEQDQRKATMDHLKAMSDYYTQQAKNHEEANDLKQQMIDNKNAADEAIRQLREENQNPINVLGGMFIKRKQAEWALKYPKGNIPDKEIAQALMEFQTGVWAPKEAWHAGAGNKASVDRMTGMQVKELEQVRTEAQKNISAYTSLGKGLYYNDHPAPGESVILRPGSPEYYEKIGQWQEQIDNSNRILNQKLGLPQTPTAGPQPVSTNVPKNPY